MCGWSLATYEALVGPHDDLHTFCPRHTSATQPTPSDSPVDSGVDEPDGPGDRGLEHLPNGTVVLRHAALGIKIHVLGAEGGPMSFLTSRDKLGEGSAHLYLLFNWREGGAEHDCHVHSLVWVRDIFESAGICPRCHEDVRTHPSHRCKAKCSKCRAPAVPIPEMPVAGEAAWSPATVNSLQGGSLVTCSDCNVNTSHYCFRL